MKDLSNLSIIVCSIVRNAEKGLLRNIAIIDNLCKNFKDYKIIVYENDSIDKTKDILNRWREKAPNNIYVSLNDVDATSTIPQQKMEVNPFYSRKRIEKMVHLRNEYIEYIQKNQWKADYVIVVDLDVAQLNYEGILSSFDSRKEWDAVTAFGFSTSPKLKRRYHDTYALTLWGDEGNPQTEFKIKTLANKLGKVKSSDEWIRVFSAFGGLAIYRYDAIKDIKYTIIPNEDDRVEVKCEHYSIYEQMFNKGYDKFYINPQMTLKYQDITLDVVSNYLKKKTQVLWNSIAGFYKNNNNL